MEKMASRSSKRKKCTSDLKKLELNLQDVICPICFCILIEPVTMPCKHELCMPCFKQNVQETSLLCPVCRKRIATWSRRAARENTLVNKERWELIQKSFPDKVQRRLAENYEDSSEEELSVSLPRICEPGEIRKEYETQLKRLKEEDAKEREVEERQSEALIKSIQETEKVEAEKRKKEALKLAEKDRVIALILTEKLNEVQNSSAEESAIVDSVLENIVHSFRPASYSGFSPAAAVGDERRTSSCFEIAPPGEPSAATREGDAKSTDDSLPTSSRKLVPVKGSCFQAQPTKCPANKTSTTEKGKPTAGKSSGKLSRSGSIESIDSISAELCHFRPIKSAPKTPPLRLPDGRVFEPKLIHATPRNISLQFADLAGGSHGLAMSKESVVKKRLLKVENDRRMKFGALLKKRAVMPNFLVASKGLRFGEVKHCLLKPLALVSSSPGNCSRAADRNARGAKVPPPGFKFASSCVVANKENPKVAVAPATHRLNTRKRKVTSHLRRTAKKLKTNDVDNARKKLRASSDVEDRNAAAAIRHYSHGHAAKVACSQRNGSTETSAVARPLRNLIHDVTGPGVRRTSRRETKGNAKAAAVEDKKVTTRLSSQRQQEAADYMFALKLQEEWNRNSHRRRHSVDRRHGTTGEYNLRRRQSTTIC